MGVLQFCNFTENFPFIIVKLIAVLMQAIRSRSQSRQRDGQTIQFDKDNNGKPSHQPRRYVIFSSPFVCFLLCSGADQIIFTSFITEFGESLLYG